MTVNSSYPKGQKVLVIPTDRLGTIVGFQYVVRTSEDTLEVVDESQVVAHCDHGIRLGVTCEACRGMAPDVVIPHG
jgi:hypothetical protein